MKNDSKNLWLDVHSEIPDARVSLGRASSNAFRTDPKMIGFMAARYKFVAKMLDGLSSVMEVGCGDGFGAPVVAQTVKRLICTDIDANTIEDNRNRLAFARNIVFEYFDFRQNHFPAPMDAVYCVDVIEHIYLSEENQFLNNIFASLTKHGIGIVGTPNQTAEQYASENSKKGHVNLKSHSSLRKLMEERFHRVFIFSMNDEVVHTGYFPMAHYLWAIGVSPRGNSA